MGYTLTSKNGRVEYIVSRNGVFVRGGTNKYVAHEMIRVHGARYSDKFDDFNVCVEIPDTQTTYYFAGSMRPDIEADARAQTVGAQNKPRRGAAKRGDVR